MERMTGLKVRTLTITWYAMCTEDRLDYRFRWVSLIDVRDGEDMGRWDGCEENPTGKIIH